MGNCHTVGPNEALVVSGEGAPREVDLERPAPGGGLGRGLCLGGRERGQAEEGL